MGNDIFGAIKTVVYRRIVGDFNVMNATALIASYRLLVRPLRCSRARC